MYLFVEIWNVKPAWLALSQSDRAAYMSNLNPAIGTLLENGIEIVGWGENQLNVSNRANFQFFAVWKMPDENQVELFQEIVEKAGWYNYFDQANLVGKLSTPDVVIAQHIELKQ